MAKKLLLDTPVQSHPTTANVVVSISFEGVNDPSTARIFVEIGHGHDDPSSPNGVFVDRTERIALGEGVVRRILQTLASWDDVEMELLVEATKQINTAGTIQ